MFTLQSTTLKIKTSVGVLANITVDNAFQDITIEIPLIDFKTGFHASGKKLKHEIEQNFLMTDHLNIFKMIFEVANEEMQHNLIFK